MASVRRSLFNNAERAKFLNHLVIGVRSILENPQVSFIFLLLFLKEQWGISPSTRNKYYAMPFRGSRTLLEATARQLMQNYLLLGPNLEIHILVIVVLNLEPFTCLLKGNYSMFVTRRLLILLNPIWFGTFPCIEVPTIPKWGSCTTSLLDIHAVF